jgi:hypothetical protein
MKSVTSMVRGSASSYLASRGRSSFIASSEMRAGLPMRQLSHLQISVFTAFIIMGRTLPVKNVHRPEESLALFIHHPGSVNAMDYQNVHGNAHINIGSIASIIVQEIEA